MIKRLSVSVQDWFYNNYLANSENISDRIRYLIQLGAEYEITNPDEKKNLVLKQAQEIQNLKADIKRLTLTIGGLKEKTKKYDPLERKVEGFKQSKILRDLI